MDHRRRIIDGVFGVGAVRFFELRDHATKRMPGMEEEPKTTFTEEEYGDLLQYISGICGTK